MASLAIWVQSSVELSVYWPDSPADFTVADLYLDAAKEAVLAFAPALTDPDPITVPESYVLAQIMHARNLWNSAKAQPSGAAEGEYGIVAYPLDWQIKQLLRPRRGIGAIV